MSHVEGTNGKLGRIVRSHKISIPLSTLKTLTEKHLHKLLCKTKD